MICPERKARVCECGAHGFLSVTRGYVAIVSPHRVDEVARDKWSLLRSDGRFYVRRANGDRKLLHRAITNATPDQIVDHHDRNSMNNTDGNLRVCNNAQNSRNQCKRKSASRFKGAHVGPKGIGWVSSISLHGKTVYLGYTRDEVEAARMYDRAAIEHFGEFAATNVSLGLLPQEAA